MEDEYFCQMLISFWIIIEIPDGLNSMYYLNYKIRKFKKYMVVWIKEKEVKDNKILCEIESIINDILLRNLIGNVTSDERDTIIDLEHKNDSLLKKLKKWLGG